MPMQMEENKMGSQTIQLARQTLSNAPKGVYIQNAPQEPAKEFYSEGQYGVSDSLNQCLSEGYQVLFMPELALARTGSNELWQNWYATPSLRATGETKQGSKVVVYAHVPNFYSKPANVRNAVANGQLKNGAGPIPQEEFDKLVSLDGNGRVFVIDYDTLRKSNSGPISVDDAIEHPQTIPFLGGEAIAKAYLAKHREAYNTSRIGVWHCDDYDKKTPRGRLLFVGYYVDYGGLFGNDVLGGYGRVFGVAPEAPVAQFCSTASEQFAARARQKR